MALFYHPDIFFTLIYFGWHLIIFNSPKLKPSNENLLTNIITVIFPGYL